MKRAGILVAAGIFVFAAAPVSATGPNPGTVDYTIGGGLAKTPHDFTAGYGATNSPGVCTSCHTPHKAQSQQLLWNRSYSGSTFTVGASATMVNGTTLPRSMAGTWGGPTPKCLSCHDGSIAIGDVGWFRAQNVSNDLGIAGPVGTEIGADGKIANTAFQVGSGGDMSGNHPVMIPFPLGGVAGTYNAITTGSSAGASGWQTDPTTNGIVLFQNTSGNNVTRVTASASGTNLGIECASCHDPHNGSGVQDRYFLRGTLDGSTTGASGYICLKCHSK